MASAIGRDRNRDSAGATQDREITDNPPANDGQSAAQVVSRVYRCSDYSMTPVDSYIGRSLELGPRWVRVPTVQHGQQR